MASIRRAVSTCALMSTCVPTHSRTAPVCSNTGTACARTWRQLPSACWRRCCESNGVRVSMACCQRCSTSARSSPCTSSPVSRGTRDSGAPVNCSYSFISLGVPSGVVVHTLSADACTRARYRAALCSSRRCASESSAVRTRTSSSASSRARARARCANSRSRASCTSCAFVSCRRTLSTCSCEELGSATAWGSSFTSSTAVQTDTAAVAALTIPLSHQFCRRRARVRCRKAG